MLRAGARPHKMVSYAKYGYLFLLPFFLVYIFFMIYPLINTFVLSFMGNGKVGTGTFVGLQNYQWLLFGLEGKRAANAIQEQFLNGLQNTAILWVGNFILQLFLSLLLAVWFSDVRVKIKGAGFFKVAMYLPNIVTAASVAAIFLMLFGTTKYGAINAMFMNLGWFQEPVKFLESEWGSRVLVMFIQSWMWYGNTMLLLMSGIYGIDTSIYEAASIDGSSGMHTFVTITMPILKPIFIYVVITSLIGGLQMFDIPYLLHEGRTIRDSLSTAAVFIYSNFHALEPNYGYSAAASVIIFIITAALGIFIFRFNSDSSAPVKMRRPK